MRTILFAVLAFVLCATGAVAQDAYRVRPGDTLTIEVLEDSSLNRNVLVTPGGGFSFPFAGSLPAAGFTTDQIAARLSGSIASNFAVPPNVFVSVRDVASATETGAVEIEEETISVFFFGEVGDPGQQELEPGITFLQGLSRSGGLTNFAAERRIQLRRTDPVTLQETVTTINYRALQRGARLTTNVVLIDGDVILVPERGLFE